MARYIDADLLLKKLIEEKKFYPIVLETIRNTPTADVEEVKHGYWKHSVEFGFVAKYHFWNCSLCGVASEDEGNEKYCRECGAKMDGVKKNDL